MTRRKVLKGRVWENLHLQRQAGREMQWACELTVKVVGQLPSPEPADYRRAVYHSWKQSVKWPSYGDVFEF
jgi:hypothetical protein